MMLYEVLEALNDCETDEIPNHAPTDDEYVFIYECEAPEVACNNCHAVTTHLAEVLGGEFEDLNMIRVDFDAPAVHYALEWNQVVIDYTMRQYDADADFPYVGHVDNWLKKVKRGGKTTHGGEIENVRIGAAV